MIYTEIGKEGYMPDFDKKIKEIADEKHIDYINIAPKSGNYITTDGNHLYKKAAQKVTLETLSSIIKVDEQD
ncbi:MAG: hypothetical protein AB8B69_19825 [Chitinophagales bacterium]